LSSLYQYLCDQNAVAHNPVLGVKRSPSQNRYGKTPVLADHEAGALLAMPPADTLKGKRDRAILATPLFRPVKNNTTPEGTDRPLHLQSVYNLVKYYPLYPLPFVRSRQD
jgi:hypothetical protein